MWLKNILHLPAEVMTGLATVIGFALIGNLDADEQNALGNMLFLIGQILSSNATQLQANQPSPTDELEQRIKALEQRISSLTP
ncbi:MAG: hypothetical protein IJF14_01585 [Clostridia bacterium]|nr:hypothetical protein [Clostridia bacterium]